MQQQLQQQHQSQLQQLQQTQQQQEQTQQQLQQTQQQLQQHPQLADDQEEKDEIDEDVEDEEFIDEVQNRREPVACMAYCKCLQTLHLACFICHELYVSFRTPRCLFLLYGLEYETSQICDDCKKIKCNKNNKNLWEPCCLHLLLLSYL
jgi:flagellar motor protein MotB